jgi:L-asparaginase II
MVSEVAAAAEVDAASLPRAVDGCGVVTVGLTLERMAHVFSRLPALDGGPRVVRAMCAHPDLVRGPGAADTELMRSLPGWYAKGGVEGLVCAASPEGLGVALKVEDGSVRAVRSALVAFLGDLGVDLEDLAVDPVRNSRGEAVGEIRPAR